MTWVSTILAVIKFIVSEVPKFMESWRKASKDDHYNNNIERFNDAYKKYKKSLTLEDLNELSK